MAEKTKITINVGGFVVTVIWGESLLLSDSWLE